MKRHASMNRIYRLVWSHVLNAWVAVSETARGRGKKTNRKLTAVALSLSAAMAQAAPTGGQVVSGAGSISQSGNTTTIRQSSQNLSLNWQSFNIAPQETINFLQPSASAIAVNRIFGTDGTQILGHLEANGQVWLINPNGILFGPGAEVNVGSLVATTLDFNDATLNGNTISFTGKGTGSVVNQGTINAANGGYVALIGNQVSNQGTITAQVGTVALGASSAATLTFSGNNLVHMQVDQSTLNNLAENGGLIQADGGQVIMTAGAQNALLASVVNNTGVIEARTVENHEGTITLLGGMTAGTVNVGGKLDASAPNGGNGGFIETSAAHVEVANDAKVTTAAESGLTGSWLLDPVGFTIAPTGGDITGSALDTLLQNNSVTIQTATGTNTSTNLYGTTSGSGNINVDDAVSWSSHTLTLDAYNNIYINSTMNGSGTASLALYYGQGAVAVDNTSTYVLNNGAQINLPAGPNFSTKLGSDGGVIDYTVITSLGSPTSSNDGTLQGINGNLSGYYALGSNIDATATSNWNGNAGFTPIGNSSTPFNGTFDGLGHTISNLVINLPSTNYVGLFGDTDTDSLIQNVGLIGGSVSGSNYVGGLVGSNNGTVSNSYATGSVSGNYGVGGLVGSNYGTVSNSYATGSVSGNYGVGGLVGNNYGTVSSSYTTGSVSGSNYIGGLVGSNNGTVSSSYATGSVSGSNYVGGLAGSNYGTVSNGFYNSTVNPGLTGIGGADDEGGTVFGITTAQLQTQANFISATPDNGNVNPGWDFTNTWVIYDGYTYPLLRSFMTPLTVTANSATQTYNGQAYSGSNGVTYSVTPNSNLLGTISISGNASSAINAGSYTITPEGLYSNQQGYIISYVDGTLTINPAPLRLTGLSGTNRAYNGTTVDALTGTAVLSGLVANETLTLGNTTNGTLASANAGSEAVTTNITLSNGTNGGLVSNYVLTQPTLANVTIAQAPLTVTANDLSKTFGTTDPQFIYSVSGLVSGDSASSILPGALSRDPGETSGTYSILQGSLTTTNSNYILDFIPGTLTIVPLVLTADSFVFPTIPAKPGSPLSPSVRPVTSQATNQIDSRPAEATLIPETFTSDELANAVRISIVDGGILIPADYLTDQPQDK